MRRLGWLLVPLCALAGACGGGDDEGGSPSRAEFVEQANEVCSKWNSGIVIARDALPAKPTTRQYNSYVKVLLLGMRSQIAEIGVLGYPEDDQAELDAIFDDARAVLDRIEAKPRVASEPSAFADVYARLKEYGLVACAR